MKRRNLFKGLLALAVVPRMVAKTPEPEVGSFRGVAFNDPAFDPINYRGEVRWINVSYKTP